MTLLVNGVCVCERERGGERERVNFYFSIS